MCRKAEKQAKPQQYHDYFRTFVQNCKSTTLSKCHQCQIHVDWYSHVVAIDDVFWGIYEGGWLLEILSFAVIAGGIQVLSYRTISLSLQTNKGEGWYTRTSHNIAIHVRGLLRIPTSSTWTQVSMYTNKSCIFATMVPELPPYAYSSVSGNFVFTCKWGYVTGSLPTSYSFCIDSVLKLWLWGRKIIVSKQ